MIKIGVIGKGIVGKAIEIGFRDKCELLFNDPKLETSVSKATIVKECDFIFVSVPTPYNEKCKIVDDTIISQVIKELDSIAIAANRKPIAIVKSAIPPRIVQEWIRRHNNIDLVISPEYLREAHFMRDFVNQKTMILGGSYAACQEVEKLYLEHSICNKDCKVGFCAAEEAALIKYMENSFLAMRNIFYNQFKDYYDKFIGSESDYNFNSLMDIFHLDERMGVLPDPYRVPGPDGHRGYGGKCFYKDVNAIIGEANILGIDLSLMKEVNAANERIRTDRDWERINGAIS
jgi:UDPglucose 6-dehydrogenase